jgi:hypothetical protein
MPLDFPNSPALNQVFTAGTASWQWDGTKWTAVSSTSTSGYLPLSGGTMTGPLNYTSTGGTTSRSAQNRGSDIVNVLDFGAKLDGTTNDSAAFNSARAYAHSLVGSAGGGVIEVPHGHKNVLGTVTYSAPGMLWRLNGLTDPTGTVPSTNVASGDPVESVFNSGKYLGRVDPAAAALGPVLRVDYTGQGPGSGVLWANFNGSNSGNMNTYGVLSTITQNQTGTGQQCGLASTVTRTAGGTDLFSLWTQIKDLSGVPSSSHGHVFVGYELDMNANGPELDAAGTFDPGNGALCGMLIDAIGNQPAAWAANHAYTVPTTIQPVTPNGYVYVLQTAGKSDVTEPVWPTAAGTVADGTCVWAYGTTQKLQVSRAFDVGTRAGTNASFGSALILHAPIYDAAIELSTGSLDTVTNPNAAAIRLAADMPIDWSGNVTLAGQNKHITTYNSTAAAWQYVANGTTLISAADSGVVALGGKVTLAAGSASFGAPIVPMIDNTTTLGQSALRWTVVYAANGTINTSDVRLKRDIAPLPSCLDIVDAIDPITFRWKDSADDARTHWGFDGQAVRDVMGADFAGVVNPADNDEDGPVGLASHELIPVLWRAIKELRAEVEALRGGV